MVVAPTHCSICGLVIPPNIASWVHPLYGTVDHKIPKSKGGDKARHNRFPAHLHCNQTKGNRLQLERSELELLQKYVMQLLEHFGSKVTKKQLKAARKRIHFTATPPKPTRAEVTDRMILSWEDDGGAICM